MCFSWGKLPVSQWGLFWNKWRLIFLNLIGNFIWINRERPRLCLYKRSWNAVLLSSWIAAGGLVLTHEISYEIGGQSPPQWLSSHMDHHDPMVSCLPASLLTFPGSLQALGHSLGAKDSVILGDLALTWNFHVFVGLSQTLILLQYNVFVV